MTLLVKALATVAVVVWVALIGSLVGMIAIDDPLHPVLSVVFLVSVALLLGGAGIGITVILLSTIWRP